MKKILKYGVIAAASYLLAAPASAALVSIQEVDVGNGMSSGGLVLPVDTRTINYWAGLQKLVINSSASVLAFCVDPWEWTSPNTVNYSTNNLGSIFGAAKANMIGELYSEAYSSTLLPGNLGGNLNAAAFQLALWEIIADDNPAIAGLQANLNNGLVHVVQGTNASLIAATNVLLSHIDGVYGNENYTFSFYTNGRSAGQAGPAGYQDFLVANRVPEPGTISLIVSALSALSGLSVLGLRRRQSSRP